MVVDLPLKLRPPSWKPQNRGSVHRRGLSVCVCVRFWAMALPVAGFLLPALGCKDASILSSQEILKPLTTIQEVRVSEEKGRAQAVIVGDTPFEYRIAFEPRLQAIVVRIPDAIYDEKSDKHQEFTQGAVSRVEVTERKALIQTVEVKVYPRSAPVADESRRFEHVREGSRLLISWLIPGEREAAAAGERDERGRPGMSPAGPAAARDEPKSPLSPISPLGRRTPAASSLSSTPRAPSLPRPQDYRVGPKDVLRITVYREAELSGEFAVAGNGAINYPLLGRVPVEGQTISQIESILETLLAKDYLLNPSLSVKVAEYRSQQVQLLGAVRKPGTYALRGPTTVLEIISEGGGVDPGEGGSKVVVLRRRSGREEDDQFFTVDLNVLLKGADLSENLVLHGNDTVFVPRADTIFVFGQVKSPGPYKIMDRQVTLAEAISMAGGLTRIASANRTRVIRFEGGAERVITVPLDDILKGDKSKDIRLVAEDIVFVPESFF